MERAWEERGKGMGRAWEERGKSVKSAWEERGKQVLHGDCTDLGHQSRSHIRLTLLLQGLHLVEGKHVKWHEFKGLWEDQLAR